VTDCEHYVTVSLYTCSLFDSRLDWWCRSVSMLYCGRYIKLCSCTTCLFLSCNYTVA